MRDAWLAHHGIFGMKWGIRRFQNKDGSLTSAGKKRYSSKDVEDDFNKSIDSNKDAYDRIRSTGSKISDAADALMKDYEKQFNSVQLSPDAKKRINSNLEAELGKGCDDPELFSIVVEDYVRDEMMKSVNSNIKEKRSSFEKMQSDYWSDVHSITDELMSKYKDEQIDGKFGNSGRIVLNEMISKKLDTSFNSYISRHFDDYWVYDTDAYYDAISRLSKDFSMDDYNRKHGG